MIEVVKATIFDLDGTLVDLPINYEILYEKFRKIIGTANIEPVTKTVDALKPSVKQKVFDAWTDVEFAALPDMTIVNEGIKLYQQYQNTPRALVTMQGKKTVGKILVTLEKFSFTAIITREDSLDRTAQIEMAIEKLGLRPENVIVFGNRETDKTAAEKAGCKFKMVKR